MIPNRKNKTIETLVDSFYNKKPFLLKLSKIIVDNIHKKTYLTYKDRRVAMIYWGETDKRNTHYSGYIARKGIKDSVLLERFAQLGLSMRLGYRGEWLIKHNSDKIKKYGDIGKWAPMEELASQRGFVKIDWNNKLPIIS